MIKKIVKQIDITKDEYFNFYFDICERLKKEALDEINFMFSVGYGLKFKIKEKLVKKDMVNIKVTLFYTCEKYTPERFPLPRGENNE